MRHLIPNRRARLLTCSAALAPALLLGACAAFPSLATRTQKPRSLGDVLAETPEAGLVNPSPTRNRSELITLPGGTAAAPRVAPPAATAAEIAALVPDSPIDVSLPPQPLPQFLDTVFGNLLHLPYALGPEIGARKDVITLRSAPHMSRRAFFELVQGALRDYGLVVAIRGGAVSVQEGGATPSDRSLILRSRSAADTPDSSRTVVQFVQLYAVDAGAMQTLVTDLFPGARTIKIVPSQAGNFLTLTGAGRDVASAVAMIVELDKPRFAGAQVARFEPTFSAVDAFSKALSDALTTEGFIISNQPLVARGIMILPLPAANQVLAFAGDPAVMSRIQFWAAELDKPSVVGDRVTSFVYTVRNTDAATLGALAKGQTPTPFTPTAPTGVPNSAASLTANGTSQTPAAVPATVPNALGTVAGQLPGGGSIVVDTNGNRILFTGTAVQFAQLRTFLQQLDVPPRQVLIEVTVAEVTLTDMTEVGLQWFFNHSEVNGDTGATKQSLIGQTQGLGIGATGLNLGYVNNIIPGIGSLTAQFNAYANNNNVNIISRPRVIAKSGGEANIQVGTDIPIISSQAAAIGVQTNATTDVLQSVQYRQTGVILKVKPTIYGDDRVDVQIDQEVSNSLGGVSGSISSPTIQNRSLTTELSLADGHTAVLGGLISNSYTKGNAGIPFLKDVPILGSVFRTDSLSGTRDELVILITPHILRDTDEMSAVADAMTSEVNRAFKVGTGYSYTLSPFVTGFNLGGGPPPHPDTLDLGRVVERARSRASQDPPVPRSDATPDDRR